VFYKTMNRFLMLDIGAGTLDVLYYNTKDDLHYKAVVRSPILTVQDKAESLPGDLLVIGREMGGGSLSEVLVERAKRGDVIISTSAAATLHHDLEKVLSWGIKVIDDSAAENLRRMKNESVLVLEDIDLERLKAIVQAFGVPFSFDVVGICAQDHGVPPMGISHLDYRHSLFMAALDKNPFPHTLLFRDAEIPPTFNRLRCISESARALPADEIYVMDSGMAAILGASLDPRARRKQKILVLDLATSHTVGATLERGQIAGFFEYHTKDMTFQKLDSLVIELADGRLIHENILREGGHGAYMRKAVGLQSVEIMVATGPKRRMVEKSCFPVVFGAPLGDNMMTGTVGLLEAIRRRKGLSQMSYS
jgi:uncharacterized protein (DUF1786 family)